MTLEFSRACLPGDAQDTRLFKNREKQNFIYKKDVHR